MSSGADIALRMVSEGGVGKNHVDGVLALSPNISLETCFFTKATGSGYLVDGHRYLAHTGGQPEVEVWLERDDVVEGKDTVVEVAIRWIEGRTPRRPSGRRAP